MPTIIENLTKAIEVIESVPEERLDLHAYASDCGTMFCTAGWLAQDPFFKAQGMAFKKMTIGRKEYVAQVVNEKYEDAHISTDYDERNTWVDTMFGPAAFYRLFTARDDGSFDSDIELEHENLTDKQLAILRLDQQLKVMLDVD